MADPVQMGIDKAKGVLSFNRNASELAGLNKGHFSFNIEDTADGKQVGVFQVRKDGQLLRENRSKPFPAGAVTKKSDELNKMNFNVYLKIHDASIDFYGVFSSSN